MSLGNILGTVAAGPALGVSPEVTLAATMRRGQKREVSVATAHQETVPQGSVFWARSEKGRSERTCQVNIASQVRNFVRCVTIPMALPTFSRLCEASGAENNVALVALCAGAHSKPMNSEQNTDAGNSADFLKQRAGVSGFIGLGPEDYLMG